MGIGRHGGINFSVSGIPYWTEDIGGYLPPDGGWSTPANNELFTRWFEKGVFDPVFRIHGQGDRELYGDQWSAQTKAALKLSDQLRYRLMPYIYSLAGQVTQDDYTLMRPLVMDFPNDHHVYNLTDEYMFGPSFLVAPVTRAGATSRPVYLPSGLWYDFWTGTPVTGGQTITAAAPYDHIPLYVRAGSVIPMGAADSQYAAQAAAPTEIRVYPGANGGFKLYSDAGDGYGYTTGASQTIPVTYDDSAAKVTLGAAQGTDPGAPSTRTLRVVVVNGSDGAGVGETATAPASVYRNQELTVPAAATGSPNVGQSLGMPAEPSVGSATVTATVVNAGPGTATGVTTTLGVPQEWTATPQQPAGTADLPAGGSVTSSWTVTPPGGTPVATGQVTAHTTYTVPNGPGGALDSAGTVTVTGGAVQPPWRTAQSTQAYFGQSGGQFAIDAAGADIFKNGAESDDDGILDSHAEAGAGLTAPVWLRLSRSGTTYAGSYSTDGSTWTPVGSATVTAAAASQDVGMIATSHSSGAPGLDTFSGFTLSP